MLAILSYFGPVEFSRRLVLSICEMFAHTFALWNEKSRNSFLMTRWLDDGCVRICNCSIITEEFFQSFVFMFFYIISYDLKIPYYNYGFL